MSNPSTVISTWIVVDDATDATYFPQVRAKSDSRRAQDTYWRCIATFFASSLAVNPGQKHRLYTNSKPPVVEGLSLADQLAMWNVEIVELPITYRLPRGRVNFWGNQFYIFDIIRHIAMSDTDKRHIVLDSDCIWIKPADGMERAIDSAGVLTYDVYRDQRDPDRLINGVSNRQLGAFLSQQSGGDYGEIVYCGGEQFSCTTIGAAALLQNLGIYWQASLNEVPGAPREEAHLLSLLYALGGYPIGTADPFIRRIWTSFRLHTASAEDVNLTVWHLPAEKVTGLARLFRCLPRGGCPAEALCDFGFNLARYSALLGVPRRTAGKLASDTALLAASRLALRLGR